MNKINLSALAFLIIICSFQSTTTRNTILRTINTKHTKQHYIFPDKNTQAPLAYPEAKIKFATNKEALEQAKKDIITFQTKPMNGTMTAYELLFEEACSKMLPVLSKEIKKSLNIKKPTFIFDIDETVLSNMDLFVQTNFSSAKGGDESFVFRLDKKCTAIKPMINFCKQLRTMGYKLIFISSRRGPEKIIQATRENLQEQGFEVDDIDGLFLTPMEVYIKKIPVGVWKESIRASLTPNYDIIGCIGDSESDFAGQHTGEITIKLPNYLY